MCLETPAISFDIFDQWCTDEAWEMASPLAGERVGERVGSVYPPGTDAFFRRWVACTVAGEAVGFPVAAALAATQDLSHLPEFAILLGAGAIEGVLLGRGQAMALTRLQLPSAIIRLWPVATGSVAAVAAWSIGLIPRLNPSNVLVAPGQAGC